MTFYALQITAGGWHGKILAGHPAFIYHEQSKMIDHFPNKLFCH
jgi:hypothetical protein